MLFPAGSASLFSGFFSGEEGCLVFSNGVGCLRYLWRIGRLRAKEEEEASLLFILAFVETGIFSGSSLDVWEFFRSVEGLFVSSSISVKDSPSSKLE